MTLTGGVVLLAATILLPSATPADDSISGSASNVGSRVTLSSGDTDHLADSYFKSAAAKGPFHDYRTVSVCGGGGPDSGNEGDLCPQSWGMCRIASGGGEGPAVVVYRRVVEQDGTPVAGPPGQWQQVALTCWPERVPGNANALTMGMIRQAFRDTDFTKPTVNIQPEGDVTLVNLPTFFEVQFPEAGFGPDEVDRPDPATLLGHEVEIRPRLESITYHLGERTVGPTKDLGGPYPDGTVVQTYTRPGEQQVRADIVYSGQFRVGGSAWIDIPGTVELQGTPVTLTVREAKARLYSN